MTEREHDVTVGQERERDVQEGQEPACLEWDAVCAGFFTRLNLTTKHRVWTAAEWSETKDYVDDSVASHVSCIFFSSVK